MRRYLVTTEWGSQCHKSALNITHPVRSLTPLLPTPASQIYFLEIPSTGLRAYRVIQYTTMPFLKHFSLASTAPPSAFPPPLSQALASLHPERDDSHISVSSLDPFPELQTRLCKGCPRTAQPQLSGSELDGLGCTAQSLSRHCGWPSPSCLSLTSTSSESVTLKSPPKHHIHQVQVVPHRKLKLFFFF